MANRSQIDKSLVAAAAIFGGATLDEIRFKVAAYFRLMAPDVGDPDDGTIDYFQILDAVEPVAGFWSEDRIRHLVETIGILERVNDAEDLYKRRDTLKLEDVRKEVFRGRPTTVSARFVEELKSEVARTHEVSRRAVFDTVRSAFLNAYQLLQASGGDFPSPFFASDPDAGLYPFTGNRSLTAAFDQISLLVEAPDLVPNLQYRDIDAVVTVARAMLERALGRQLPPTDLYGDGGGIALLKADEDFPGSDRPAVPSNALFLICGRLAQLLLPSAAPATLSDGSIRVVHFLLNHQLESGLWGAHAYPSRFFGDNVLRNGNLFFSALTVSALRMWHDVCDDALAARCAGALRKCGAALFDGLLLDREFTNHATEPSGPGEAAATAHALTAILGTLQFLDDKDLTRAKAAAQRCVNWITKNWEISDGTSGNTDYIRFRPPTTSGPADTFMTWEQPGHAQVLSSLSLAALSSMVEIDEKCWQKMHRACSVITSESADGFWMDVGLRDKIQASNTSTCAMSLARFLAATRKIDGKE